MQFGGRTFRLQQGKSDFTLKQALVLLWSIRKWFLNRGEIQRCSAGYPWGVTTPIRISICALNRTRSEVSSWLRQNIGSRVYLQTMPVRRTNRKLTELFGFRNKFFPLG